MKYLLTAVMLMALLHACCMYYSSCASDPANVCPISFHWTHQHFWMEKDGLFFAGFFCTPLPTSSPPPQTLHICFAKNTYRVPGTNWFTVYHVLLMELRWSGTYVRTPSGRKIGGMLTWCTFFVKSRLYCFSPRASRVVTLSIYYSFVCGNFFRGT